MLSHLFDSKLTVPTEHIGKGKTYAFSQSYVGTPSDSMPITPRLCRVDRHSAHAIPRSCVFNVCSSVVC